MSMVQGVKIKMTPNPKQLKICEKGLENVIISNSTIFINISSYYKLEFSGPL